MNYTGKINLLRLQGAIVRRLQGRTEARECLIIPLDGSNMFVGEKGVYLDISAFEMETPDGEGNTHTIRQSVNKKILDLMAEEQRKTIPYLGRMRPARTAIQQAAQTAEPLAILPTYDGEDLPF